jgi:hypothetical protein
MEEVTRLEHALQTGKFPKDLFPGSVTETTSQTSESHQSTTTTNNTNMEQKDSTTHETSKQP